MGERITIRITDGERTSPMLYCHWAGPNALRATEVAVKWSRRDPGNVMCNLVVIMMNFGTHDKSFYLFNNGDCKGIAEWNFCDWTYDLGSRTWRTNYPGLEDMELTTDDAMELLTDIGNENDDPEVD